MSSRIVGHVHDEASSDPSVDDRHQHVHDPVQARVLHGGHGPGSHYGPADGNVEGDLLVGRPLNVRVYVGLAESLDDLRRWRARIAHDQLNPRLDRSPSYRVISHKEGSLSGGVFLNSQFRPPGVPRGNDKNRALNAA